MGLRMGLLPQENVGAEKAWVGGRTGDDDFMPLNR